ncbi:hypothetical protein HJC99_01500 [Candidatus Saccharibacteria bacterium]|nr:hypothetical protein [Candidatus Saccharibacteria bacterium]
MTNIQYTIRNIPPALDQVIRKRAQQSGKSFNKTVVDLLVQQAFGTKEVPVDDNFDWLFGVNTLDPSFDEAIAEQSKPDPKMWA